MQHGLRTTGNRWSVSQWIWAVAFAVLAAGLSAGPSFAGDNLPSKAFFEDYINKKVETYANYRKEGIEPFLAMTLENNRAFRCVTSSGEEVDFDGYVETYKYTFERWVYEAITPVGVVINPISDDELLVKYTLRMRGKTRAGAAYDRLRENEYTFMRIPADDTQKLNELSPQNIEKYFKEDEDKWVVTKIVYGF